jgi:Inverse autotransporter, beta-domain
MKRLLFFILLFLPLYSDAQPMNSFSLWRTQGQSIYSKKSYTTLESFSFPIQINNIHPFFDLRYHHFDTGKNGVSTGVGLRMDFANLNRILGINAFYDYRSVSHGGLNQIGLGLEFLGEYWNFRLNGYLPVGPKSQRFFFCFFDGYIGDFFFQHEKFHDSLKGLNFEVEGVIKGSGSSEFGVAIAPYYYHRKRGCQHHIFGSEFRLRGTLNNYFTASVLTSYDNVFKGRIQAQIGLTLPLYFLPNQNDRFRIGDPNPRLHQRVQRNDSIIIKSRNRWKWNF